MSKIDGPVQFTGSVSMSGPFYPPASSFGNSHFSTDPLQRLAATKAEHQHAVTIELFGPTTTISALTKWLHLCRATGTLVSVEAVHAVLATGADRTVTIDLQKSTGGGAFATVLSTPLTFNTQSTAVRTAQAATISASSLVDGDILQAVVTVDGVAGVQGQGLTLTLNVREQPE